MAAGFKVRRIAASTQSIGDRLKKARIRKRVSIAEAEEVTKIRSKFLLALEADCWEQIPSEVYGRGYLERYVAFLQLPLDELMLQYDRNRAIYAKRCQDSKVEFAPHTTLRLPRTVITARMMLVSISALAVLSAIGVIGYQLERFVKAPYLQIATPAEAKELSSTQTGETSRVVIHGNTTTDASITVNGTLATVAPDGSFSQPVQLSKGVNAVVVEATSQNGKSTSEILSVIVR